LTGLQGGGDLLRRLRLLQKIEFVSVIKRRRQIAVKALLMLLVLDFLFAAQCCTTEVLFSKTWPMNFILVKANNFLSVHFRQGRGMQRLKKETKTM